MIKLGAILKWSMSVPLRFQILLPRRRCICNSHWLPARLIFLISIFAYSLFTAAQFLRRWFSVLTQTVTQTRKNQLELSALERMMLWKFPSGKAQKWLEISAKNIRPTFGSKRPRVRIPTLRPNPAEIFRFQLDFSAFSELFPMENSVTFPFAPPATQTGIWSEKRRKINFAACRSFSGRRRSYFSLYFSQNAVLCLQQRIFWGIPSLMLCR